MPIGRPIAERDRDIQKAREAYLASLEDDIDDYDEDDD